MARVIVAMSGGVDSSVAAALLVEAGHGVSGVTMRLQGEESEGGCCPSGSIRDARAVCDVLGIPHYTWDMREAFSAGVVEPFVDAYAAGETPNPCTACNERVKFATLLPKALAAGADVLATGHYARILDIEGAPRLARGADRRKDQSYFLYRMTAIQLERVAFPVGELSKAEVRTAAERFGLPTAHRRESQEACFVPGGDVRAFLRDRRPEAFEPGPIVEADGTVVGSHDGAVGFTVGQRRGLGGGSAERRYVTSVRPREGVVVVGDRGGLCAKAVEASDVVWNGQEGLSEVTASVRYRGHEGSAVATLDAGVLRVEFDEPVWGVAPGQALVCWRGDTVIGGGKIVGRDS